MSGETVKNFTVSYSLELHRGGEKTSHFVSAGVEFLTPVPISDFPLAHMESSYKVAVATIHDALVRGSLTLEQANERISLLRQNVDNLRAALVKPETSSVDNGNDSRSDS
jgi:hypothetical protein